MKISFDYNITVIRWTTGVGVITLELIIVIHALDDDMNQWLLFA